MKRIDYGLDCFMYTNESMPNYKYMGCYSCLGHRLLTNIITKFKLPLCLYLFPPPSCFYSSGYNDKQEILLHKLINKMVTFEIDPKRYEIMKEKYKRALVNFKVSFTMAVDLCKETKEATV